MADESLINAAFGKQWDEVLSLLGSGAEVEATDEGGRTALHYVAVHGNAEIARALIDAGADVNASDNTGWTPLHSAAIHQHLGLAKLLLKNGAEVDPQDDHGNTPLSNAVYYSEGRGDLILLLLDHGADPNRKNRHGVSPLSLAKTIASVDVERFFKRQAKVRGKSEGRRQAKRSPQRDSHAKSRDGTDGFGRNPTPRQSSTAAGRARLESERGVSVGNGWGTRAMPWNVAADSPHA